MARSWILKMFFKWLHFHTWKTTHTNKWLHPIKQECKCGLIREFEFIPDMKNMNVMEHKKGRWAWSNGKYSTYNLKL